METFELAGLHVEGAAESAGFVVPGVEFAVPLLLADWIVAVSLVVVQWLLVPMLVVVLRTLAAGRRRVCGYSLSTGFACLHLASWNDVHIADD